MIRRCDLVSQYEAYQNEIDQAIARVLKSGVYILGPELAAFEKQFSGYLGAPHSAGVANATDGLTLALKALGVGPGDEVITPCFTAIPTAAAIHAAGATPKFIDIDPATFLMDLNRVKQAITSRTKAVMPVHLFGNMVDIDALRKIVGAAVFIVEDAAQAHGATWNGRQAGSLGDCGVFSFYPTKNLGAYGDGGLVASRSKDLIEKIKLLRMYGMTDKDHVAINGINSRLDEIQAAVLAVKLRHLDEMNKKRIRWADIYKSQVRKDLLQFQLIPSEVTPNFHVLAARVKNNNRDRLMAHLDQAGIQTNVYYPLPLPLQKANAFLNYKKGDFPQAESVCADIIALPMYPEMDEKTVRTVIDRINSFEVKP